MIDEKDLLDLIIKQVDANHKHLQFIKDRLGEDWVRENHEEEYLDVANTALLEFALSLDLINDQEFRERVE